MDLNDSVNAFVEQDILVKDGNKCNICKDYMKEKYAMYKVFRLILLAKRT